MNKVKFTLICLFMLSLSSFAQQYNFTWITELEYQRVEGFSEGLAPVYDGNLWGYINNKGEIIIEPQFASASNFAEGRAIVSKNNLLGIIDKAGNNIIPCEYDNINPYNSGFALATKGDKQYYLSMLGEVKSLPARYEYFDFSEGVAIIKSKNKNKFGYVNTSGSVIVEPRYLYADNFSKGRAYVTSKSGSFLINEKGNVIDRILRDNIIPQFNDGYAQFTSFGKWGLTDGMKTIIPMSYDAIGKYSEGFVPVKSNNSWGYIQLNKSKITPQFSEVGPFQGGIASVKTISKYGYIDASGTLIIDDIFDQATPMENGYATVTINNRCGIIKRRDYKDKFGALVCSSISTKEENQNKLIEPNEKFSLKFNLKNTGNKPVENIRIIPKLDMNTTSLVSKVEEINIEKLDATKSIVIEIPVQATEQVNGSELEFSFSISATTIFETISTSCKVKTIGTDAGYAKIKSFWFHNQDFDEITPGDTVLATIAVKNTGEGIAKKVNLTIGWPSYLKTNASNNYNIGQLMPKEEYTITSTFSIDTACQKTDIILYSSLTTNDDATKQEQNYLNLPIGEFHKMINLLDRPQMAPNWTPKQDIRAQNNKQPLINQSEKERFNDELIATIKSSPYVSPANHNRFALIIGNEDYQGSSARNEVDVQYALNDADAFAVYAERIFGVPQNNTILLKNGTHAMIQQSLDKITRVSNSLEGNAELIVYYAGHAQRDPNTKLTYLIPTDVSLTSPENGIALAMLYNKLGACNASKVNVYLDACYSGVSRGIVVNTDDNQVPGNILVMASCSSSETSKPYEAKQHGLFTYFLLETLANTEGKIKYSQLYDSVKSSVKQHSIWVNSSEQTPQLLEGIGLKQGWEEEKINE